MDTPDICCTIVADGYVRFEFNDKSLHTKNDSGGNSVSAILAVWDMGL